MQVNINFTFILGYLWIFGTLPAVHQRNINEKSKETPSQWSGENRIFANNLSSC